jgi:hypothetical protein
VDADEDIARPRHRPLDLPDAQDLGRPVPVVHDSLQRSLLGIEVITAG